MSLSDKMFRTGALNGIRVLDMTRVVAGPYCCQILGDLGADVVKLERRGEGDDVRRVGPPWMKDKAGVDTEESTYFQAVNRNKRSIQVDYSKPEGAQLVRDLAARADVFIENYRPRTLDAHGIGYADLKLVNPRLVYCSISGFGQDGPYSTRSGYDYLVQGMAGVMSVTGPRDGEPGAEPTRVGVPIADITAGLYAAIAVLAAINHRHASGVGQHIDVSLFESQLAAMLNSFSAWFNGDTLLGRTGNDHPSAAPYGVFEVLDGHILIATFNDREFVRLARLLGHAEWATDERFATNGARVANRLLLKEAVGTVLRLKPKADWVRILNEGKVSCGPINDMSDLDSDPHLIARQTVIQLEHPVLGVVKSAASPMRFSDSPVTYRRAPPLAGEQMQDVLSEWLALDPARIEALRASEVV